MIESITWPPPVSRVDIDGEDVEMSELKAIVRWARAKMAEDGELAEAFDRQFATKAEVVPSQIVPAGIAVAAGLEPGVTLDGLYARLASLREAVRSSSVVMNGVQSVLHKAFQTAHLNPNYDYENDPYNVADWVKVELNAYVRGLRKRIEEMRKAGARWPEPRGIDDDVMDGREVLVWAGGEWLLARFVDQGGVGGWYADKGRILNSVTHYLPLPPDLEDES